MEPENKEEVKSEIVKEEKTEVVSSQVDPDAVVARARDAVIADVKKEIEAALKSTKNVSNEDVKKEIERAIRSDRASLAKLISGEKDEPQVDPIIQTFANNPAEFVNKVVSIAEKRSDEKRAKERELEQEAQKAYSEVLASRPDVTNSQAAQKLFVSFYEQTDETKDEVARYKEALSEYDKLMEEQGAGKADERIKEAAGLTSTAGQAGTGGGQKSTWDSFWQDAGAEQKAKVEAFNKSRNRYIPT